MKTIIIFSYCLLYTTLAVGQQTDAEAYLRDCYLSTYPDLTDTPKSLDPNLDSLLYNLAEIEQIMLKEGLLREVSTKAY